MYDFNHFAAAGLRRRLRRWAVLSTLALAAMVPSIGAGLPTQPVSQVPGYFRMQLGTFDVTALYDGHVGIDAALLGGAGRPTIDAALAAAFLARAAPVQTAVNAYLVRTGANLILVDTGTAKLFGDHLGYLLANLRAAGYAPEQVDTILLTHLHPDHAGGLLTATGNMAFPNAQVFVPKADADYWLSPKQAAAAPKDKQALFGMSRDAIAPYRAAGKLTVFAPGQVLREGVSAVRAPGHTPGHTAYLFSSDKQNLLVWGDIVHNAAVQFPHPQVAIEFDWDQPRAVATRRALLSQAASRAWWIAGAHVPFPGVGRIQAGKDGAYRWVPTEYGPVHEQP
ncbi:MBL fold metallo-hydrolase [Pseudoduganella umbonata]|uniref:Glyoxylase-like metal-dependent hydrolase (Beta-lactamase superfamily II) n=1 Tax=Pseudoduganella umbonata TaxID=864828 RepID=A0A4V1ED17_9BURK|nr:MBL fold metallo-hydrolase [Pseudoduganella umbonata]MBB3219431.1 glyoxylase-like metal-dependent hydrolase (beta-lactamase superfamily II) [Pseudoduganella umbonata]QCP09521.1 MBL fold metallo-hydrolase [Pseudoduganella umbonata]